MSASDQRLTVLQIINEARAKTKLNPVTTVAGDSDSLTKLMYLNDVIAEVSDYGPWQESLREFTISAVSSVADYNVSVSSAPIIQRIHEVVFGDDIQAMSKVDLDQIRRLNRLGGTGVPTQWGIVGTDSNSNPVIRVYPTPGANQDGSTFKILAYEKPSYLTTADGATVPVFPGRLLVQGLLAKVVYDESDGEPTERYQNSKAMFNEMLTQSYNRYNGDSGSTVYFKPSRGR